MSGLEVAGALLGAFPLIISGLEHWRDVARVGGFYWRVRKEYNKSRNDVQFYEIVYKRNLKELLLPIISDADEVTRLIGDPGGKGWSDQALQVRLEGRLQESYTVYMDIIQTMNETAAELKTHLGFDKAPVQDKLIPPDPKKQARPPSPQPSVKPSRLATAKSKLNYEAFRVQFSFSEPVRKELFAQLEKCNDRLEKLLGTSDKISALQSTSPSATKQTSALETAFKKAWRKSDRLFKALQKAWKCPCQQYHFANLRLEHRTLPEICFELILMFVAPSSHGSTPWSWRELQCGHMMGCSFPRKLLQSSATRGPITCPPAVAPAPTSLPSRNKVAFAVPTPAPPQLELDVLVDPSIKLCELLGEECGKCMGIIGHDDETYHLHPLLKSKRPVDDGPFTLDHVLSKDFEGHVSRRQRYSIALLLASSVAQLQFTPWLRTGLAKEDVIFFAADDGTNIAYSEPFIRRGFPLYQPVPSATEANDCNFYSLGILLLELCFGRRLEDHPLRKKHPTGDADTKQAFDLMAALKWSQGVADEGGDDYAAAVRWCFTGASNTNQSWRGEIIKNVVQPLEMCQQHFRTTIGT